MGNFLVERCFKRFNGAAGIHRRKPRLIATSGAAVSTLQWGRRNSPAETSFLSLVVGAVVSGASMGPPEFTGGNLTSAALATESASELQWGRRNSPAETYYYIYSFGTR